MLAPRPRAEDVYRTAQPHEVRHACGHEPVTPPPKQKPVIPDSICLRERLSLQIMPASQKSATN
jgi:hypothetical protein